MISIQEFKGEQGVVLENEKIKAIILPNIGGKVASFYSKETDFELLFQNKEDLYKVPNIYSDFARFDAAGFDDAFPSIDEGEVEVGNDIVKYPDHGEIWSAKFKYEIVQNTLVMRYQSKILSYTYKKSIHIEGNSLIINYCIENTKETPIPCLWAMHCLMNCEDDMEIIFPEGTDEILNVNDSDDLGEVLTVHNYPITKTINGDEYRLDRVKPASAKCCEKYYISDKVKEGSSGAYYPSNSVTYTVNFDKEKLPYSGLWITSGGFRGDYNCALEPANGFYDSIDIAKENDKLYYLKKEKPLEFQIEMVLEKS